PRARARARSEGEERGAARRHLRAYEVQSAGARKDRAAGTMEAPDVGSAVRVTSKVLAAPKPGMGPKGRSRGAGGGGGVDVLTVSRRSIVATPPDEAGRVSLVQDDPAPEPLGRMGKFLIAPMFNSVGVQVDECEVSVSEAMPLLEFERNNCHGGGDVAAQHDDHTLVQRYKDYVDCIEDNDNPQYDVAYPQLQEDATITRKEILMAVWTRDVKYLQPRILLNLSRCLIKLGQIDATRGNASCVGEKLSSSKAKSSRQERYKLAAVWGCSIALSLCEYRLFADGATAELDALVDKARLVRARAFLDLRKFANATVDAKKVVARNSANREAQSLLSEIKATEAYGKAADKKLSKEVARWVQTATSSSKAAEAMERMDGSVSEDDSEEDQGRFERVEKDESVFWLIARTVSMEICGLAGFLIAMWVIYPSSSTEKS
ncbi:hypothetical protein ACHAWF_007820, partial [Thalassiosira exigua]